MRDDRIDPHLRHDFPRSRWWSPWSWWRSPPRRLAQWLLRRGYSPPLDEILVLRLLILGLTAIVLVETLLLLLSPCVPLLLGVA